MDKAAEAFLRLKQIVQRLRDPNGGCPWDLKQTHETLKPYVIEEAYEVVEAIDQSPLALSKELGDLLLQVVLHSQIAEDNKTFTILDVLNNLSDKLVKRHPHVFSDTKVLDDREVLQNWEKIKEKELEKGQGLLSSVPKALPALLRAQRISEKAARVGFEWDTIEEIRDKVLEEVVEFSTASLKNDSNREEMEDEFGDIFFALVQLARRLDFNAEDLLQKSTNKFVSRFEKMEARAKSALGDLTLEQLNELWEEVKREE